MNILLINHYAGSPIYGMEFRPFYMAREWRRRGHFVTILAASFSHLRQIAPNAPSSPTVESHEGIEYVWLRTPAYRGNGIRRVFNICWFVVSAIVHRGGINRTGVPFDVVIASSTYPLDIFAAWWIAKRDKAIVVYEVHDLWPLSLMELAGMSRFHPFIIMLDRAERFAYRHADRIISLLPYAKDHMVERGMRPDKFSYVPNGIDLPTWHKERATLPEEYRRAIDNAKSRNALIVGYAGSHGVANALDTILQAAGMMQQDQVHFILVGQGPEKKRLQQLAAASGMVNVTFLPALSREHIPLLLHEMDVLYFGMQARSIYRYGISPNKLFDYMMAGRPLIAGFEDRERMIEKIDCGIVVKPEDADSLAIAVRRMKALSASERDALGERGRLYVIAHHTYTVLSAAFLDAIENVH